MSGELPRPVKPSHVDAPGLIYRLRQSGWVLSWSPRSDLAERGFSLKSDENRKNKQVRLWPPSAATEHPLEPTIEEWEGIGAWCRRYQAEMLQWARGGVPDDPLSIFDGTIKSLSKIYQTDRDSPFHNLRHVSYTNYTQRLMVIEAVLGAVRVKDIGFRDLKGWFDAFAEPEVLGGKMKKARAYSLMNMVKELLKFGALVLPETSGCLKLVQLLCSPPAKGRRALLTFPGRQRKSKVFITYEQAKAVCEEARRQSVHSLALAQALMFEAGVRQKDIIGEWVPRGDAGVTDVVRGQRKWLIGMRWEEVGDDWIWTHRLSKSIHGQSSIMDLEEGKTEEFDLRAYPMVMEELRWLQKCDTAFSVETSLDGTPIGTRSIHAENQNVSGKQEPQQPRSEMKPTAGLTKIWVGDRRHLRAHRPAVGRLQVPGAMAHDRPGRRHSRHRQELP
jgi:hypothetical protein